MIKPNLSIYTNPAGEVRRRLGRFSHREGQGQSRQWIKMIVYEAIRPRVCAKWPPLGTSLFTLMKLCCTDEGVLVDGKLVPKELTGACVDQSGQENLTRRSFTSPVWKYSYWSCRPLDEVQRHWHRSLVTDCLVRTAQALGDCGIDYVHLCEEKAFENWMRGKK